MDYSATLASRIILLLSAFGGMVFPNGVRAEKITDLERVQAIPGPSYNRDLFGGWGGGGGGVPRIQLFHGMPIKVGVEASLRMKAMRDSRPKKRTVEEIPSLFLQVISSNLRSTSLPSERWGYFSPGHIIITG